MVAVGAESVELEFTGSWRVAGIHGELYGWTRIDRWREQVEVIDMTLLVIEPSSSLDLIYHIGLWAASGE